MKNRTVFVWINRRKLALALMGVATWALSSFGQQAPSSLPAFNATFAFGFSWTDTHSDCNWSPCCYYNHLASNGPLWCQYLGSQLGLSDSQYNQAHCGALTTDVLEQALDFKRNNVDMSEGLCLVMSGATDFLFQGLYHEGDLSNDTLWAGYIQAWVSNNVQTVVTLYQQGARAVLVHNCFDVGRLPRILRTVQSTSLPLIASRTSAFNDALVAAMQSLQLQYPDLKLILVDFRSELDYVVNNASTLGFTVTTIDVLDDPTLSDKSFTGPGANYVFWDGAHATTKAHGLFANWTYQALLAAYH